MMVRQHIPNFVDGVEPGKAMVESLADLDQVQWIRSWRYYGDFYRFSQTPDGCLMAEFQSGAEYWVIGYLEQPMPGLPIWMHR